MREYCTATVRSAAPGLLLPAAVYSFRSVLG